MSEPRTIYVVSKYGSRAIIGLFDDPTLAERCLAICPDHGGTRAPWITKLPVNPNAAHLREGSRYFRVRCRMVDRNSGRVAWSVEPCDPEAPGTQSNWRQHADGGGETKTWAKTEDDALTIGQERRAQSRARRAERLSALREWHKLVREPQ